MELKLNDENSFDPTPKLISSPVPIFFISFNERDNNCIRCRRKYIQTILSEQNYCIKCLLSYLTNVNNSPKYLDVRLFKKDLKHNKHVKVSQIPIFRHIAINSMQILCFKQIIGYYKMFDNTLHDLHDIVSEDEKYCKLCGKLLYQEIDHMFIIEFKLCSSCYLISSGRIESTLTKKFISIIYLPLWENTSICYCNSALTFTSDCQKYCENCFIFFIGCRYCLTTNIIFGITNQSQCKKCKRISNIILDSKKIISINSGNSVLDDFLVNIRSYQSKIAKFSNNVKNINKYFIPSKICDSLRNDKSELVKYIPYSQFTNVKEIAKGGFSIVYQAETTRNSVVVLKRFKNFEYSKKYFMNELKSNHRCRRSNFTVNIIKTFGFTKDPNLEDYVLVMEHASEGDLHKYLQKKFSVIDWGQKLNILYRISTGLEDIHVANFVHRDFHSGNIMVNLRINNDNDYRIGDLGLSRPANNTSSDNEIYGVIPYIAPEIFKESAFSKESDIYSFGMIMWELTTGCKPFSNVEHDHNLIFNIIDGVRPEITEDTPKCYANLMKRCWDIDPKKRPSISEILNICFAWKNLPRRDNQFDLAELKRKELIDSKKLDPELSGKPHPKAVYTSRSLNSYISKCSTINFSSNDYITKELEYDIDFESSGSNVIGTKRNIKELNINSCDNSRKHIKIGSSCSRISLTSIKKSNNK